MFLALARHERGPEVKKDQRAALGDTSLMRRFLQRQNHPAAQLGSSFKEGELVRVERVCGDSFTGRFKGFNRNRNRVLIATEAGQRWVSPSNATITIIA